MPTTTPPAAPEGGWPSARTARSPARRRASLRFDPRQRGQGRGSGAGAPDRPQGAHRRRVVRALSGGGAGRPHRGQARAQESLRRYDRPRPDRQAHRAALRYRSASAIYPGGHRPIHPRRRRRQDRRRREDREQARQGGRRGRAQAPRRARPAFSAASSPLPSPRASSRPIRPAACGGRQGSGASAA